MVSALQVITVVAAIVTIITGVIGITQRFGDISNKLPEIDNLTPDTPSPLIAGNTVIWTTKATDLDGDAIQYKFFLNGNPMTDWSPQSFWVWSNTKTNPGENHIEVCIRDGKHANKDSYDDFKVTDFTIIEGNQSPMPATNSPPPVATPNQPPSINGLTSTPNNGPQPAGTAIIDSNPIVVSNYSASIGIARTNEYIKNGVEPNCEPESKQAICSSPDSCVDCNGKCWPPESYDSGKTTCSQGKWTLTGYIRANEYVKNGVEPDCESGSEKALCSSPYSCVDCNGKCFSPGSYDSGKTTCSQGKWTLPWANHIYK